MTEFLTTITAFPTVVFTVVLALVLLYWVLALAANLLGAADHNHNGIPDFLEAAHLPDGADSGLHHWLDAAGVASVPLTLLLSFMAVWGWVLAFAGTRWLGPLSTGWGVLAAGFIGILAVLPAGWTARRLVGPKPQAPARRDRRSLLGRVARVHFKVTHKSGSVLVEDGGAGLQLWARLPEGRFEEQELPPGEEVLLFDYDSREDTYWVAPLRRADHWRERVRNVLE